MGRAEDSLLDQRRYGHGLATDKPQSKPALLRNFPYEAVMSAHSPYVLNEGGIRSTLKFLDVIPTILRDE